MIRSYLAGCLLLIAVLSMGSWDSCSALGTGDSRTARIDAYVVKEMRNGRIPGLSLGIVQDGSLYYIKGYGKADPAGRRVTPDTPFPLGSISKTFTALAVRQLVNEGKIDTSASVNGYLPWFATADAKKTYATITIGNLLDHRSGFSREQGGADKLYDTDMSAEELMKGLKAIKLAHTPGSIQEYSNINFVLLGLVVEKASGTSFNEYIERRIFKPLGFDDSYTDQEDAEAHGLTQGFRSFFGLIRPFNPKMPRGQLAAGFMMSSARDMCAYLQTYANNGHLKDGSIIPNNTLPHRKPGDGLVLPYYGIYWVPSYSIPLDYRESYGHSGSWLNNHATLSVFPKTRSGIIVLTNSRIDYHTGGPVTNSTTIAKGIADIMAGSPPPDNGDFGYGRSYLVYNLSSLALIALAIVRMIGAIRSKGFKYAKGLGKLYGAMILFLLDFALPVVLIVNLKMTKPDYILITIPVSGMLLISALLRIWKAIKPPVVGVAA